MSVWAGRFRGHFPKVPKICAGFIEAHQFGAAADILEDLAVIRIHASVPTMVSNLVTSILSHPNGFAVHGSEIQVHDQGVRIETANLEEALFNNGRLFKLPTSFPIAVALCNFIVFHEFIHIRNGHVDLFKKSIGLLAMEEAYSETSWELTPLDRQAMEWDADKIAHWLSTDVALSTLLGKPLNECPVEDAREAFRVYHLCLYLLFKLIEVVELRSIGPRVHPTPIVRMSFLLTQMKSLAEMLKIGPMPDEVAANLVRSGEVAWALITNQSFAKIAAVVERMNDQVHDGIAILRQWNDLRERLAPFNRGTTELARANPD